MDKKKQLPIIIAAAVAIICVIVGTIFGVKAYRAKQFDAEVESAIEQMKATYNNFEASEEVSNHWDYYLELTCFYDILDESIQDAVSDQYTEYVQLMESYFTEYFDTALNAAMIDLDAEDLTVDDVKSAIEEVESLKGLLEYYAESFSALEEYIPIADDYLSAANSKITYLEFKERINKLTVDVESDYDKSVLENYIEQLTSLIDEINASKMDEDQKQELVGVCNALIELYQSILDESQTASNDNGSNSGNSNNNSNNSSNTGNGGSSNGGASNGGSSGGGSSNGGSSGGGSSDNGGTSDGGSSDNGGGSANTSVAPFSITFNGVAYWCPSEIRNRATDASQITAVNDPNCEQINGVNVIAWVVGSYIVYADANGTVMR